MCVANESKSPLADLERGKVLTQATTHKGFGPPHCITWGVVTYNDTISMLFRLSEV